MTGKPDDWSSFSHVWTEPATDDRERAEQDRALIRTVMRRERLGRLNFYIEAASCIGAALVGGWFLAFSEDRAIGAAALLFGVLSLAMTLWARSAARTLSLETPEQALRTALSQAEAGLRWAWAGAGISLAAMGFMATVLLSVPSIHVATPARLIALGLLMLVGMGIYIRHGLRSHKRIARHRAALEELTGD